MASKDAHFGEDGWGRHLKAVKNGLAALGIERALTERRHGRQCDGQLRIAHKRSAKGSTPLMVRKQRFLLKHLEPSVAARTIDAPHYAGRSVPLLSDW